MKLAKAAAALCAFSVIAVSGCGAPTGAPSADIAAEETSAAPGTGAAQTGVTEGTEGTAASVTADTSDDPPVTAESITAGMSLENKIAQMIMITFRHWTDGAEGDDAAIVAATELNEKQKALLTKYDFGGICLFTGNIKDAGQTVKLTAEIQEAALAGENGIPLLIAADQEGGSIYRLTTGTSTCGNMALGATGDVQAVSDTAAIIGSELNALGINTDFAPVIDVNNNPANPVINVRSFSSDPDMAARFGNAFIDGLESEGVISTVKHFPGHGDTDTDSHTGLPMIDKTLDELKETELVPFIAAADKADMVMTAHIQFPKIEHNTYISAESGESMVLPATLSDTIVRGILRGEIGYDGVVITDAMLMDAIDANFDPLDAAVLAINADVDMLLEPMYIVNDEGIEAIGDYIDAIAGAVRDGRISEAEIDDSVARIISLKMEKGLIGSEPVNVDEAASAAKAVVGSKEHHDKELEIAERAVTLVKNDNDTLPLKLQENDMVAFFYPFDGDQNTIIYALEKLKADGTVPGSVTAESCCVTDKSAGEYEDVIGRSAAVILAVETYRLENMDSAEKRGWQAVFADELITEAHRLGKKVIVMSMNFPYDTARYTEADALLCGYCGNEMPVLPTEYDGNTVTYGPNYPAALITVLGGNVPTGKLPVDVPALDENTRYTDEILYPIGYGLTY